MSDIYKEYEWVIKLVVEEYKILEKLNSKHKALGLMKKVDDNSFVGTKEFSKRYYEESRKNRLLHYMDVHMNYYLELKKGVTEELEKIISRRKRKILKSRKGEEYEDILQKMVEEKDI